MVGATLPAAPSVRKQKSIAFSMLFGRTIVTLAVLPIKNLALRSPHELKIRRGPQREVGLSLH
jgi:hypothetical protein